MPKRDEMVTDTMLVAYPQHRVGYGPIIVGIRVESGASSRFHQRGRAGRYNRCAASHRLDRGYAEAFPMRGMKQDICATE
jgi:hypothetical protein